MHQGDCEKEVQAMIFRQKKNELETWESWEIKGNVGQHKLAQE